MEVTLEPSVLRWVRDRAGLSVEDLARKVGTRPEKVSAWETTGQLTARQAEKLAQKAHVPLGYLYLNSPLTEILPVADFRTVGSGVVKAPSPELLETLDIALARQEWFRDYAIANREEALDWVGRLTGDEDIEAAAAWVRQRFSLQTDDRTLASSWEDALRQHCEGLERAGVLVMRSGIVGENTHRPLNVEEFRGFALADSFAPLLFINSKDWKAAQMFTLMHELVHLVMNVSGVSNLVQTYAREQRIERFCNSVAAEILVPAVELRERFAKGFQDVTELGRHFRVSLLVILRRLLDLDLINRAEFIRRYREIETGFQTKADSEEGGGGNYYRTKVSRLGKRFAVALLESALEGKTAPREAFRLLGVRNTQTLRNLAKALEFAL